jgi:hypothetical protein
MNHLTSKRCDRERGNWRSLEWCPWWILALHCRNWAVLKLVIVRRLIGTNLTLHWRVSVHWCMNVHSDASTHRPQCRMVNRIDRRSIPFEYFLIIFWKSLRSMISHFRLYFQNVPWIVLDLLAWSSILEVMIDNWKLTGLSVSIFWNRRSPIKMAWISNNYRKTRSYGQIRMRSESCCVAEEKNIRERKHTVQKIFHGSCGNPNPFRFMIIHVPE